MQDNLQFLSEQNVDNALICKVEEFRREYPITDEVRNRVVQPSIPFYGKDILEMALAALLEGSNLLLSGAKDREKIFWRKIWHGIFYRPVYIFHLT